MAPSRPIIHHSSSLLAIFPGISFGIWKSARIQLTFVNQSPRPLAYKDPLNTIVSFLILFCFPLVFFLGIGFGLSFSVRHASNHIKPELNLKPIFYTHLSWISHHLDSGRNYTNISPTPGTPRFVRRLVSIVVRTNPTLEKSCHLQESQRIQ